MNSGEDKRRLPRLSIFWAVVAVSVVVFSGHAFFSRASDLMVSVEFGIAGGFGALVFDILRTVHTWLLEAKNDH